MAQFESNVQRIDSALLRQVETELNLLRGTQGFFDSGQIRVEDWKAFLQRIKYPAIHQGLRSVGLVQFIKPEQQVDFIHLIEKENHIHPIQDPLGTERGAFIRFLAPPVIRTEAYDVNLFKEPVRNEALRKAVENDDLAFTPPVKMLAEPRVNPLHPVGMVAYLPVFHRHALPTNVKERWEAAVGAVLVSMRPSVLFEAELAKYPMVKVEVRDQETLSSGPPIFSNFDAGSQNQPTLVVHRTLGLRTWIFTYRDTFVLHSWRVFAREVLPLPLAGVALAILFFFLTRWLVRGRLRAEGLVAQLQQSEERFRWVAEQVPCGIMLFTEKIRYVNPFLLRLFDMEASRVLGTSFRDYVHPDDHALIPAPRSLTKGITRLELRALTKTGESLWLDVTLSPVLVGHYPMVLATLFDITERRRLQEAHLEARLETERDRLEARKHESLRLLAGGIAHDFNNLLGVILGHADLAERGSRTPDPNLQSLREACFRAAGLTRQLLAFSGGGGMVSKPTDLNACIQRAGTRIAPALGGEARLQLTMEPQLAKVLADPVLLEETILGLIENGLEASQANQGPVEVRSETRRLDQTELAEYRETRDLGPGRYVYFSVEDHGEGMSPEHLAQIFDPFFSTKFVGRGLGLAALLGVVKSYRGGVKVSSRAGLGTLFEVILPAHEIMETATSTTHFEPAAGRGAVLMVDDEPEILDLGVEALRRAGLTVHSALGGREALTQVTLHRDEISLMVLDMAMPDMNGAEVIRAVRASDPGIRIIISSGYAEEDLRQSILPEDVAAFLPKPYRLADLVTLVKGMVANEKE
ncbi:MAG: CHASE domain-containing protein [Firmicutes bacterium]|nr:CHASE domain-containing protein [Bacillota bacterium]